MTSFAVDEIAALELLKQGGADTGATRTAGVADHARHGDVLALFEDLVEVALEALVERALDAAGTGLQLFHFHAKIAERMLPGIVRGVPARFELCASILTVIEILLQRLDLAHRL